VEDREVEREALEEQEALGEQEVLGEQLHIMRSKN
jgi:hypothetical protein